jgi:hypothetical protein
MFSQALIKAGSDRLYSKLLMARVSGADDVCVEPSLRSVPQATVLSSLILERSQTVQTDLTRDNA